MVEGDREEGWMWGLEGRERWGRCKWEARLMRVFLCSLDDINKNCLEEFRKHWKCLDNNNQQLWHCRRPEQLLNKCVFDKLVRMLPTTSVSQRERGSCIFYVTESRKKDPRLTGKRDTNTPTQNTDILAQYFEYTGG